MTQAPSTGVRDRLSLWSHQALILATNEISNVLLRRRAMPLYLLVAMPLFLAFIFIFVSGVDLPFIKTAFAVVFLFLTRFVIFFGCAGLFVHALRGEILDRSMHYLLLLPVRREVLVIGKYLGSLVSAILVLVPATALMFLFIHLPLGWSKLLQHLFSGPGLAHLGLYLFTVVLGCIGYGAVFLAAGLIFRNPMIPAGLFLLWEVATPFLPPLLKAASIVHYLISLTPVPVPLGPFEILAQPISPWLAVPGLLTFSLLLLITSALLIRRLEISYTAE